jgi:cell wall-associated NlpC family hydrolase
MPSRRAATIAAVTTGTLAASTAAFAATLPHVGNNPEPTAIDSASLIASGGGEGAQASLNARIGGAATPVFTSLQVSADQTSVTPNGQVMFTVRATEAGGQALGGQTIRIAMQDGPRWITTATLQTDSSGTAHISARLLSTTTITAVFDGTNALRPAVGGTATVSVRGAGSATVAGGVAADGSGSGSVSVPVVIPGSTIGSKAVYLASLQKGKPYVYGATGPYAFDCSGLVQYVFKQLGRSLPRTAQEQFDSTPSVPNSAKQVGDLIFFGTPGNIWHVAIYAGNGYIWSAPQTGRTVTLEKIWTTHYYTTRVL